MMLLDEARQYMTAVFGPEWEWKLAAEGIVGGTDGDDVYTDKIRVVTLAKRERPDLDEEALKGVGEAWFTIWCNPPESL